MECKSGGVAGGDGGSVGEENVNWGICELAVGVRSVDMNIVASTAAVDNALGEGRGGRLG
jgi:hypothetical protein